MLEEGLGVAWANCRRLSFPILKSLDAGVPVLPFTATDEDVVPIFEVPERIGSELEGGKEAAHCSD